MSHYQISSIAFATLPKITASQTTLAAGTAVLSERQHWPYKAFLYQYSRFVMVYKGWNFMTPRTMIAFRWSFLLQTA